MKMMYQYLPGGGAIWSLCIAKGIRVISGAKSSEQNDDKMNNLDDVILRQGRALEWLTSSMRVLPMSLLTETVTSGERWWLHGEQM